MNSESKRKIALLSDFNSGSSQFSKSSSRQKKQGLMGLKRVNLGPEFQPEKCDDRLSRLPDEILVVILSCLPLKDAARTSVLSSRWTNVWRHSSCLNFDVDDTWHMAAKRDDKRMRHKYMRWVNSVLRAHKSPILDEFRICFDLDKSNGEEIAKWLEFAFARRVQRLDLSLLVDNVRVTRGSQMDDLPAEYFRHFDVKALKALCLRGVNVCGEDIEFFLRNCPFLEELIVQGMSKRSNLEVCGSKLALKHLEIFNYNHVPGHLSIKISAPKLTSLKVDTLSGLLLENVPMLVDFNLISGCWDLFMHKLVRVLHCYISQLETLTLGLNTAYEEHEFCEFPQLPKLNKLVINFVTWRDESLVSLICLIKASPHLQEVEVKMNGVRISTLVQTEKNGIITHSPPKNQNGIITHSPHQHLKVLKFSGYDGRSSDVELVRYILVNCVAIQKIIIDPRRPRFKNTYRKLTARSNAKQQLEPHVPRHIELLIL